MKKKVIVQWKDRNADWNWFYLCGFESEWVHLQGRNSPDGDKHDGELFWVHKSDISELTDAQR